MRPFGTQIQMYDEDHEWLNHSITPTHLSSQNFRATVGEGDHSYEASILNISGTSFGALSPSAIQALNNNNIIGFVSQETYTVVKKNNSNRWKMWVKKKRRKKRLSENYRKNVVVKPNVKKRRKK